MTTWSIGEAAAKCGLSQHTLRWYERIGLLASIERGGDGRRRFSQGDLDWLSLITRLRATGMPVRYMQRYAELVRSGAGEVDHATAACEALHRFAVERLRGISLGQEVARAGHDLGDARAYQRVGTGRRRPVVGARLHGHVHGRSRCRLARSRERDDLGVGAALALVPPLPDDRAVAHDDGPDDRVRIRRAAPSLRELERPLQTHASACTSRR